MSDECEFCHSNKERLSTHHLIPRWLNGTETMELCSSCHSSLEQQFDSFIKWQSFKAIQWRNLEKARLWGQRPDQKAKGRAYQQRPYVRAWARERSHRSDRKAKVREYNQRPYVIARRLERAHRPDDKAKMQEYQREYRQRSDIKAKKKEYQREYLQKNKARLRESKREWYQKNNARIRERAREYYRKHHSKTPPKIFADG